MTMAKLIYSAITSLDGHLADEDGRFDRAEPHEEVHDVPLRAADIRSDAVLGGSARARGDA
jgi:hypothetical protein